MKLRSRKQLLNGAAASCLAVACWVVVNALTAGPPTMESKTERGLSNRDSLASLSSRPLRIVDANSVSWQRKLRQPLYDPPPPPKKVLKKKKRPVTVKLTGTVLESKNSQAFLKLANGSVVLKRIGDPITDDPRDGHIAAITANEIVIQREDDKIRLKVGGQN